MATATGWMDRMKEAMARRRTEVVATVSAKALDAIEAMEKVEGALTRAPRKLKELRTKAVDRLEPYARRAEEKTREVRKQVVPRAQAAATRGAEPERGAGRKTVAAAVAPKRSRKPSSPRVKRGQKHTHDR